MTRWQHWWHILFDKAYRKQCRLQALCRRVEAKILRGEMP
jgi:hypothetical protein